MTDVLKRSRRGKIRSLRDPGAGQNYSARRLGPGKIEACLRDEQTGRMICRSLTVAEAHGFATALDDARFKATPPAPAED